MRNALASKDMGLVVRAFRSHPAHGDKPLSQAALARWLGVTQSQLSRIEAGRNRVRELDKLVHYASRLGIPSELLWFDVDPDPERSKITGTARLVAGPGVSAAIESTGRVDAVVAKPLLLTLQQYAVTDNLTGPHYLLPVVRQHMTLVERLLSASRGAARGDLFYVAARFAEFTGWLHQDTGDLAAAARWSNTALDYAREGGNAHLISYINMRKSHIASDARKTESAIAFARAALQDSDLLTPRLKAVALRQEAHAYALAGNDLACARALDFAFQYASDVVDEDGGDELARYCTPNYVKIEAAQCWGELGRPDKALATLQSSLADWQPAFRRDLGLGLARLVAAHAGVGEADDALTVAHKALTIAAETRSHRAVGQLRRASDVLAATGAHGHARHLRHMLSTSLNDPKS